MSTRKTVLVDEPTELLPFYRIYTYQPYKVWLEISKDFPFVMLAVGYAKNWLEDKL